MAHTLSHASSVHVLPRVVTTLALLMAAGCSDGVTGEPSQAATSIAVTVDHLEATLCHCLHGCGAGLSGAVTVNVRNLSEAPVLVQLERLQWRTPETSTTVYVDLEYGHPFNDTPPEPIPAGQSVTMAWTVALDVETFLEGTYDVIAVLGVDDEGVTVLLATQALAFAPNEACDG